MAGSMIFMGLCTGGGGAQARARGDTRDHIVTPAQPRRRGNAPAQRIQRAARGRRKIPQALSMGHGMGPEYYISSWTGWLKRRLKQCSIRPSFPVPEDMGGSSAYRPHDISNAHAKLVIQLDMKMKCAKGTPRRPIRDHIRRDRINIGLQDNSFVPLHTVIRPPPAPGRQLARLMAAARKPRICTLCETNRAGARVQRPICPPREPISLLFQVVPNLRISFPALGSLQAFPDRKTVSGSFDTK